MQRLGQHIALRCTLPACPAKRPPISVAGVGLQCEGGTGLARFSQLFNTARRPGKDAERTAEHELIVQIINNMSNCIDLSMLDTC